MDTPRHFLLVDHEANTRLQLRELLAVHFRDAAVHESQESRHAVAIAAVEKLDAIVIHRCADVDVAALVRLLRALNPQVPIVGTSRVDRAQEALATGVDHFVPHADWPQLGAIVARALRGGGGQRWSEGTP